MKMVMLMMDDGDADDDVEIKFDHGIMEIMLHIFLNFVI